MKIVKSGLPAESVLKEDETSFHYVDSYQSDFIDDFGETGIVEVGKAFFSSAPRWTVNLFAFRNRVVRLFGLKTSGKINIKTILENFTCEPGQQIGLFKIYSRTNNELLLGEDDKHLNFRVSLFIDKEKSFKGRKTITISTTVIFNNWFGRFYFFPVRPFHQLIVPDMLKGIVKELNSK